MSLELTQISLPLPNSDNSHIFLGTDTGEKNDYLGLEVIFYYDEDAQEFIFDGVNSECI